MEMIIIKPLVVGKLSLFTRMENDALMHREDLTLQALTMYHFSSLQNDFIS